MAGLAVVKRFLLLLVMWLALSGGEVSGLAIGVLAAVAATWVSSGLLPPGRARGVDLLALVRLAPGYFWRSLKGGVDVAWRAFHPSMPLKPGWLEFRTRLPAGVPTVSLGSEMSLLPGTLAAGSRGDTIYVHCLELRDDIDGQIRREERRVGAAFGLAEAANDG